MASAGDRSADVGVGELDSLLRCGAEEFFQQIRSARDAEFFRKDAERVFRGDKMDAGDAGVGLKGAECLAGEDCAGSAGDGEG
jgi:hypothetical protein